MSTGHSGGVSTTICNACGKIISRFPTPSYGVDGTMWMTYDKCAECVAREETRARKPENQEFAGEEE